MPSQGPAIASKVDESLDASKQASAAKKADDGIPEPKGGFKDDRPFYKKKRYMLPTGGAVAASLYNMGDEDEIKPDASDDTGDGTFVTDDLIVSGGGTTLPPVTDLLVIRNQVSLTM
jgi:hypothetical protein